MKILMVCLGNICRSPLADALLRDKVGKKKLDVFIDSAGTAAYHIGKQADTRTRANAAKHGLGMDFLRARQFQSSDFQEFDRIYVMDRSNYRDVSELAKNPTDMKKVQLILELIDEVVLEVPDPYYGGEQGFENVYKLLDKATDKIIEKIQKNEL